MHKIKYARIFPLMLAECFIIHKQIDDITVAIDSADPIAVFARHQRPFIPAPVGKPKRYIVAQRVIFQQQLNPLVSRRIINEIRTSAAKYPVCSLGYNTVKNAHRLYRIGKVVAVNKFGIPENSRRIAEHFLYRVAVFLNLLPEFIARIQKTQTVIIRFSEKFHTARLRKSVKRAYYFRRIFG